MPNQMLIINVLALLALKCTHDRSAISSVQLLQLFALWILQCQHSYFTMTRT